MKKIGRVVLGNGNYGYDYGTGRWFGYTSIGDRGSYPLCPNCGTPIKKDGHAEPPKDNPDAPVEDWSWSCPKIVP